MIDIINENEKMTECLEWYWFYEEADELLSAIRYRNYNLWGNFEMAHRFILEGQHDLRDIVTTAWNNFDHLQRTIKEGRER